MTKLVRPPRDGGDQWRAFGHDVDSIPPHSDDPRIYEVLYADGVRYSGNLREHEERQQKGAVPCWWRLFKPALPRPSSEAEAKLNDPKRPDGEGWERVAATALPLDALCEYVSRNGSIPIRTTVREAMKDDPFWWRHVQDDRRATLTGKASDYYLVDVRRPARGGPAYQAECLDVIEALNLTFNEGEAFKAIWRSAAARKGNGKPGTTALYDAEKVAFYGGRMVAVAKP